ncbi:hypothetical protein CLI75_11845, partial [Porphyromonas gingivalis]
QTFTHHCIGISNYELLHILWRIRANHGIIIHFFLIDTTERVMTDLSMSHQSIDGLNKNIADARTCMNKLRSLEAKAQLAETLS